MHHHIKHSRMYSTLRLRRIMRTARTVARIAIIIAMIPALYLAMCIMLLAFHA